MQNYFFNFFLFITIYVTGVSCLANPIEKYVPFEEVICRSTTVRSVEDFNKLQNCTVVAGYVRIVQMDFTLEALKKVKSSNIEEISEYLLVYRVEGLDSLERLFPKLIIIRGVELLYDEYALAILENRDMKNIGLVSLLRVLKGSIRIEYNPSMCFTKTINWVSILGNDKKQYDYVIKHNKLTIHCPICYTYQDGVAKREERRHKKCWGIGKFQKTTKDYSRDKRCFEGNEKNNCLTSCSNRKCRHCTGFVSNEGCVVNCLPPKYRLAFKRQCVTNCTEYGLIQMGMKCMDKCPKHYQEVKRNGVTNCVLNCKGNFVVHNIEDLEGLADCTTIEGSLTIELHEIEKPIVQHLEHAFRHLNEITGYLKIVNTPQIVSLYFFKNLHTIKGSELLENRYSLYVVENRYLEELWMGNVIILHGCIFVHLNPLLCYEKVVGLEKNLKECKKITVHDVSTNSNGEKAVCGEDVHDINVSVLDVNSDAAVVKMDLIPNSDLFLIIGYSYHYKEAPYRNVTRYDSRHGCGLDNWFTDILVTKRIHHILKNLKPATQYAFFVKSMTIMDYPFHAEFISEIKYFQTLPKKPSKVAKMFAHSLVSTEIEVHWWPPRFKNGIIEKYLLHYERTDEIIPSERIGQTTIDVCQCPNLDNKSTVPTPHVKNYYYKEQYKYKDRLLNFLLVKRKPSNRTRTTAKPDEFDDAEERLNNFLRELKLKGIQKQEEAKETYVIPHPDPVCNETNLNSQGEKETKCTPLETFEDTIEIPGDQHSYKLKYLEPEKTYRISVRACVKDLANGCGPKKIILAETVSKSIEVLIKTLRSLREY